MSKKKKTGITVAFAVLLICAGIAAAVLNRKQTTEDYKQFQIEIVSDRDGYDERMSYQSDQEYLGAFLRELEECHFTESDYGIYITGFEGQDGKLMMEDIANQYWWCVTVNHEDSALGADAIPLADGDVYTFTLKQGW
ncbi:MAG: DUF4430 domain-containing protein [Clostridiales bacterium]|nr:DUF4430 domain-containing protein [Clostridiales bacterium]